METKKSGRNAVIDITRGICVLAVLIAHSYQRGYYPEDYTDSRLISFILKWYMALFVLLSGYTTGISASKRGGNIPIIRRFLSLIIPTFVWSIVLWLIHSWKFVGISWYFDFDAYSFGEYILLLLRRPTYVVWFLYVIFIYNLVLWLAIKVMKRLHHGEYDDLVKIASAILGGGIMYIFTKLNIPDMFANDIMGAAGIAAYWIFFFAGYLVSNLYESRVKLFPLLVTATGMLVLVKVLAYCNVVSVEFQTVDVWLDMGLICILGYGIQKLEGINSNILHWGIEKLKWLGEHSLSIYLFQLAFLNCGIGTGKLRVLSIFVCALIFSVVVTIIVEKSKVLSAVFLGKFGER